MLIYSKGLKAKKETEADLLQGKTGNGRHRLKACILEQTVEEHSGAHILKASRNMRGTR